MKNFVTLTVKGISGDYKDDQGQPALRLTFDFNEIADAEAVSGCNLLRALGSPGRMTATEMRGMLYALLRKAQPTITLKEAGEVLTKDTLAATDALIECVSAVESEGAVVSDPPKPEGAPPAA